MIKVLNKILLLVMATAILLSCKKTTSNIFLEAESFRESGGWVIDQQSIDVMGSSYILAHGLGVPVRDAQTTINVTSGGDYNVWVRTCDWVAKWDAEGSPGRFQLLINDVPVETT